jgi:two-component system, cell cycle response regulator DivK
VGGPAIQSRRRAATVLIVEDDEVVRELLGASFEAAGMRVEHAASREAAMRSARRTRPDALVIDRHLPDGDGWAAVEELRRLAGNCEMVVVAMTSHVGLRAAERALVAGCDAFLEKPCDPDTVVENARRLLAARSPTTAVRRRSARDT